MTEQGFPFSREFIKKLQNAKLIKFTDEISVNALREVSLGLKTLIKSIQNNSENNNMNGNQITNDMPDLCILGFMAGFLYYHDNFKKSGIDDPE